MQGTCHARIIEQLCVMIVAMPIKSPSRSIAFLDFLQAHEMSWFNWQATTVANPCAMAGLHYATYREFCLSLALALHQAWASQGLHKSHHLPRHADDGNSNIRTRFVTRTVKVFIWHIHRPLLWLSSSSATKFGATIESLMIGSWWMSLWQLEAVLTCKQGTPQSVWL